MMQVELVLTAKEVQKIINDHVEKVIDLPSAYRKYKVVLDWQSDHGLKIKINQEDNSEENPLAKFSTILEMIGDDSE